MHVSELEPIYWILEDALYKNKTDEAQAMYELLCATAKQNPSLLRHGLQKKQIERLKEIAFEIYDKNFYVKKHAVEIKCPKEPKAIGFRNEKELEDYLARHLQVLESALHEKLRLVGTQVITDFEYACDIVVESSKTFYPIELKIGQSNHCAISQIDKYCFYFYRILRYDRYKPIQGVVISNGQDAYSINEIRKNGHLLFDIQPVVGGIMLVQI